MKNILWTISLLAAGALAGCGKAEAPPGSARPAPASSKAPAAAATDEMDDPEFESLPDLHEDSREW
jgi:uncharacterized lipoprotein YbaY